MKRTSWRRLGLSLCLLWLASASALASGPRFVTGPPFFPGYQSLPIGWKQANLLYSTDPGNLSASVPHAAADALVAAAAGVWNVPVASITVGKGGQLAEHVSGANVYLDTSGMVYPADVMSTNAAAIPLAVIYDTDGTVTDTLLGAGASGPRSCNSNAVTSTVDSFDPAGYILHAIIILNGRCTGPAPAQQLQMLYKLERAFGRVLGLAWSQANDNVFTGTPAPTYNQALHWPIMHPIDILCGPYSYQCLPNPFTLRPDDVASMVMVYPIGPNAVVPAGKQTSLAAANGVSGTMTFPNGQGMAGVNVVVQRQEMNLPLDAWEEVTAVTGAQFRRADVSPFVAAGAGTVASMGTVSQQFPGYYQVPYIPLDAGYTFANLTVSTEAVNPLYTNAYSLGPYALNAVAPSGSSPVPVTSFQVGATFSVPENFSIADAAGVCGTGLDGVAADPAQIAATGWWNATLCGYGHASYLGVDVKPGRTFTIEATALDANGLATTAKAMPVIGLFAPGDYTSQPGNLPSLGVAVTAFQGLAYGTTVLSGSTGQLNRVTIGVADERGDGRPDYPYQGRMFYADNVEPAKVPSTGGTVTITGLGFRGGNALLINGVAATVSSWSANAIVATVPTMSAAHATGGTAVDVEVLDRGTGATSTITGGLIYSAAASLPNAMILLSAPAGTLPVGVAAAVPLSVRVVAQDGVTPIAGDKIVFSTTTGSASFGCGASLCSAVTDATGIATTGVTPLGPGAITLQAADGTLLQTASFTAQSQPNSMAVLLAPTGSFPVGSPMATPFVVRVYGPDGVTGLPNQRISFTVVAGSAVFAACNTAVCTSTTDVTGAGYVFITPTAAGTVTLQAADDSLKQQITFTAIQLVDTMVATSVPNATGYVGEDVGIFSVQLRLGDGSYDRGEPVVFTVSPGVLLSGCPTQAACTLYTNSFGVVGGHLSATTVGSFTVQARYGGLTQVVSFTTTARGLSFKVLSVPLGKTAVGTADATPFTVQLLGLDGVTPLAGYDVVLGGPEGQVLLSACHDGTCLVATDGNGMISTLATPLVAGTIPITAVYGQLVATTSVTGFSPMDSLVVVAQPGSAAVYPGDLVALRVQLLEPDGVTPDAGKNVTFTVTTGSLAFTSCGSGPCAMVTDAQGFASPTGIAGTTGPVAITVSYGSVTATISFTVVAPPHVLKLVTTPPSGGVAGIAAAQPFAVRVLQADGVTPIVGENVAFSVIAGSATLTACGGAAACTISSNATGLVSSGVIPGAAGAVTLQAADQNVTQDVTFTVLNQPDMLQLISAPASGTYIGTVASSPLTVQVLLASGAPAPVGKNVTVAVTNGSATLASCGSALSCVLATSQDGSISTGVTPRAAGIVTLSVTDGSANLTASFTAVARPDDVELVSAPANGSLVGDASPTAFAVRVFAGDGVTPLAGHAVVLSVSSGSATLVACGSASCTLLTDENGLVSSAVIPLLAGAITLEAADGAVVQNTTFTAANKPDVLTLVSAPANGAWVGKTSAQPFSLRLTKADRMTPSVNVPITLAAVNALLGACGSSMCSIMTDANGMVSTTVTPEAPGSVSLKAVDGNLSQSAVFTAVTPPDSLAVESVPEDGSLAGSVAAVPFAVQVTMADGTYASGRSVTVTVTNAILTACGAASCVLSTNAMGIASTGVTPLRAGTVSLVAAEGTVMVAASFTAAAGPDVLSVVSVPADGTLVGNAGVSPFTVALTAYDGTPAAGHPVTVTVTNGLLAACGAASCVVAADAKGLVSTAVTPLSAGLVNLRANDGSVTVSAVFTADAPKPDLLKIVQTPGPSVHADQTAAIPFGVQMLLADGTTVVAGVKVTFSSASQGAGTVRFEACGAASCVLTTDASGLASTTVTGLSVGSLTLVAAADAASGGASVSLPFTVSADDDSLAALEGPSYVAEGAIVQATLHVLALSNGSPAVALPVAWKGSPGFVLGQAETATDSAGEAAAEYAIGPLAAGGGASATVCGWSAVCGSFTALGVGQAHLQVAVASGGGQAATGGAALMPVVVRVSDGAGHAVAGAAVTVYQTVTALTLACPPVGRCPAQPVLGSQVTVVSSAADGTVSVSPRALTGSATQTHLAFSVGTAGYITATVSSRP